jgi:hypothetical protein
VESLVLIERSIRSAGHWMLRVGRPAWALVAVLWMGGIWLVSSLEADPGVPQFWISWLLNCGHAFEFGMLSLWLALALLPRVEGPAFESTVPGTAAESTVPGTAAEPGTLRWARLEGRDIALVCALAVAWGAADEWHQAHVRGRDSTPFDLLTDACGSLSVLWIARAVAQPLSSADGTRRLGVRVAIAFVICALAGLASTLH